MTNLRHQLLMTINQGTPNQTCDATQSKFMWPHESAQRLNIYIIVS